MSEGSATRTIRALFGVPFVLLIAGCGSTSTSSPTARPTPPPTSAAASPSATSSSSASSNPACSQPGSSSGSNVAGVDPSRLILQTSDLPQGTQTWTQIADQSLGGASNGHQRGWQNADNTQRIEIDLEVAADASTAQSQWTTWCNQAEGGIIPTSTPSCPSQAPTPCAEGVGTTSSSKREVIYAWQDGSALVAVIIANGNGDVDQTYADQVASKEGSLITSSSK